MNNLISIKELTKNEILSIINRAKMFKQGQTNNINKNVCLMFFENSTRTKCSFDLAAQKLGMNIINFEASTSSLNKGESIKDTFENLLFIGINTFIIRHKDNNFINNIKKEVKYPISIINAGLGTLSHPTQALLDFMTILENYPLETINSKKISIVGDIEHSRVANSNIELFKKFGIKVNLIDTIKGGEISSIKDSDVVMLLRVQKERFEYTTKTYPTLTTNIINNYAPNSILMHPGPINREIEISSELLDSNKGQLILEQAKNGVFVRMAVMEMLNDNN